MTEIQFQVYDFASSARVERPLWLALNNWMRKVSELFVEHWANFSSTQIQATPLSIDAHPFSALQENWRTPAFGVDVSFENDSTSGMLIFDRVELLTLLMDILGGEEDVIDRELTPVETSLCELIFEQTVATIVEGWPEQEPLSFRIGELIEQPNRCRLFPAEKTLLVSGLNIQLPSAAISLQIVLAKDETCDMLGIEKRTDTKPNANNRLSQEKISEIGVRVSAGLGSAELGMSDLVSISPGDIIMLDQSVEEPVVIFANDEPMFRAWPGRTANKQALKIVSSFT